MNKKFNLKLKNNSKFYIKLTMSIIKAFKQNTTEYFIQFLENNCPEGAVEVWNSKSNLLKYDKCLGKRAKSQNAVCFEMMIMNDRIL